MVLDCCNEDVLESVSTHDVLCWLDGMANAARFGLDRMKIMIEQNGWEASEGN